MTMKNDTEKPKVGRPRKYETRKEAVRSAQAAYRERKKARKESPEVQNTIIDLSAIQPWKVKK